MMELQPFRSCRAYPTLVCACLLWMLAAYGVTVAQPAAGDVLTPHRRSQSPAVKIGLRAGVNRSAYTNDRYLDNVPFDVGDVSGETEIYSSAAGFGYNAGIEVEYPFNTTMSLLCSFEYLHVAFSSSGPVSEPCIRFDGTRVIGNSIHDFAVTMDFAKLAVAAKIDFSSWYLLGGITAEHPFATTLDRTRSLGSADCYYPGTDSLQTIAEHGTIPNPRRIHYALRLGGGLEYDLGNRLHFAPELTLDFGFNAINKSPNSDLGVYGISATLRYDL